MQFPHLCRIVASIIWLRICLRVGQYLVLFLEGSSLPLKRCSLDWRYSSRSFFISLVFATPSVTFFWIKADKSRSMGRDESVCCERKWKVSLLKVISKMYKINFKNWGFIQIICNINHPVCAIQRLPNYP